MDPADELLALERRTRGAATGPANADLLDELIEAHGRYDHDSEPAVRLRSLILRHVSAARVGSLEQRHGVFLADHVRASDLSGLDTEAPEAVRFLLGTLHGFRFEDDELTARIQRLTRELIVKSLRWCEERGEIGDMFDLLQMAPRFEGPDPEIERLRMLARLHEDRRARRRRRLLSGYLVIQAVLVVLVFPWLFINSENGRIQAEIEAAVAVDIDQSTERQFLSFSDGLYWSVITAASIGYGDITPRTTIGRAIAATLGTMGVITIGVMAGLILSWITPRRIEG